MKRLQAASAALISFVFFLSSPAQAADTVPGVIQMPGTQPAEIGNLESPGKCDNCHGGYNSAVEPAHNWRGSMMANAGRDPIFWATLAIAEQDFDGAGDLCIRCHSTAGWLAGRSTPTDGSGLQAGDSDGVECDYCHKLTNPDDSEHQGVMNGSFNANDDASGEGYYGSGMSSMWGGSDKLGPYNNAEARHQFMQSEFHRDINFCGTCHDVSNPVTGQYAHNAGALLDPHGVIRSENPQQLDDYAAFNNPPYRYGIVERTFSEFKAGAISKTLVDDYSELPLDLRAGALEAVYNAAFDPGSGSANYQNPPAPRYFSCQTCHMRAVTGKGANKKGVPTRVDLALHDMTGGNYWMAAAIKYLDDNGKLRLGGGLTALQRQAMDDAALRAREQLELAATLKVTGNAEDGLNVRVTNHTGHKLITGYPEGRRMWLNVKWYNGDTELIEVETGAYGPVTSIEFDGLTYQPESLIAPDTTPIWEAHMGMTSEWAAELIDLGLPGSLVLEYDRLTGHDGMTLQELAVPGQDGTVLPTFHFVLNNTVEKDNRIPPYGMDKAEAIRRNAAPLDQGEYATYLLEGTEVYVHYDDVLLLPPAGADSAVINLMYQPTSWEYIQFLHLANNGQNAFLADEGRNMLDAWLNTGMAAPVVMASATWGTAEPPPPDCTLDTPTLDSATASHGEVTLNWTGPTIGGYDGHTLYYDQADKAQKVADIPCPDQVCSRTYTDSSVTDGNEYCYKVTATATEPPDCESGFSNILCATPQSQGEVSYASVEILGTCQWTKSGKGKNAVEQCIDTADTYAPGNQINVLLNVHDSTGSPPVPNATVTLTVTGPEGSTLTSGSSNGNGEAEASWNTQSPNRKGNGGTPEGSYQISVSGLSSSTHEWDGSSDTVTVTISSSAAATSDHRHRGGM